MKTVYIAGPMSGVPQFNFPAFFAAEDRLQAAGFNTINPARADVSQYGEDPWMKNLTGSLIQVEKAIGFDRRKTLMGDLQMIGERCDAVYMLRGWETSSGAFAEWAFARAIGLEIMYE
jgi:hypothetical protein